MTAQKITRQGVPDLNPLGHNGRNRSCKHFFGGALVVIGHEWRTDPLCGDSYQEEILGRRCLWCTETREVR